ncbi:hypothetical protein B0H14DRAFT_2631847 [Mycena olivaceomarginata]|nr:hypothetical protein B0H14DRAFT_2631847 [Mycena olivaceomarginata]
MTGFANVFNVEFPLLAGDAKQEIFISRGVARGVFSLTLRLARRSAPRARPLSGCGTLPVVSSTGMERTTSPQYSRWDMQHWQRYEIVGAKLVLCCFRFVLTWYFASRPNFADFPRVRCIPLVAASTRFSVGLTGERVRHLRRVVCACTAPTTSSVAQKACGWCPLVRAGVAWFANESSAEDGKKIHILKCATYTPVLLACIAGTFERNGTTVLPKKSDRSDHSLVLGSKMVGGIEGREGGCGEDSGGARMSTRDRDGGGVDEAWIRMAAALSAGRELDRGGSSDRLRSAAGARGSTGPALSAVQAEDAQSMDERGAGVDGGGISRGILAATARRQWRSSIGRVGGGCGMVASKATGARRVAQGMGGRGERMGRRGGMGRAAAMWHGTRRAGGVAYGRRATESGHGARRSTRQSIAVASGRAVRLTERGNRSQGRACGPRFRVSMISSRATEAPPSKPALFDRRYSLRGRIKDPRVGLASPASHSDASATQWHATTREWHMRRAGGAGAQFPASCYRSKQPPPCSRAYCHELPLWEPFDLEKSEGSGALKG